MTWQRLIKFRAPQGQTHYGDPIINHADELLQKLEAKTLKAKVFEGSSIPALKPTGTEVEVAELIGPLTPADVPIVKCIGLNYMKHIKEAGRTPPPYPSIFIKGAPSIASWNEDIPIHPIIQKPDMLDYEGEMCILIGKDAKNVPREKALDYIAGYMVGNDISARSWQRDPKFAGNVPQWCFAKGFDKFAPVGPMLVSPSVVGLAENLRLQTLVNGEMRQDTNTDDLIFSVADIVSFSSQGTTLQEGTVIMTGTPSGVALGMDPPGWLKDGDVVEVKIEQLGSIRNRMVWEHGSMVWQKPS
ncbi:uncharacterized protein PV07_01744 [Cladophialophora immunda]|uniref:Fumarylacetoacetase-like C-terminal domain-containing protein n=1 Tax=Cladophialophora immunda TaxID=569365 RepID=A0A0D2BBV6_9EURO|nr:uncharacterized protein PV07_01744 [Cladophialophora immunda]KIW35017.1 hypothetical protein PV07_01744 [Cladophialophora immunda]